MADEQISGVIYENHKAAIKSIFRHLFYIFVYVGKVKNQFVEVFA